MGGGLAQLKRGIQANASIPLRDLIATDQSGFSAYHYAHAWGLIYMMIYYNRDDRGRRRNLQVFTNLLMLAREREVSPDDVVQAFGGPEAFDEFETRWKQWILELPYDYDPAADRERGEEED